MKASGGRPKRADDEPPLPQLTDVEFLAAELAYDAVSVLGPNKNLEEQARALYLDKLKWVDANVKAFAVTNKFWKGHHGGYTFTMEESARRRCRTRTLSSPTLI